MEEYRNVLEGILNVIMKEMSDMEEHGNRLSEIEKLREMEEIRNVLEDGLDDLLVNAIIEYEKTQECKKKEFKEECQKEENKRENK
ncbi:fk506-binding protein 15, partial [Lasius niger]